MARIKEEIRYSAEGYELKLGDRVWTRKLMWSEVRGEQVKAEWGEYSALEGRSQPLILRHANRDYRCDDCRQPISKDEMHGSTFYDHYCLECVTVNEKREYKRGKTSMTSLKDKYPKEKCYLLRLSPELYARAVKAAQEDRRSLNNWIVGVITHAVDSLEKKEDL